MIRPLFATCLFALCLAACLENEEDITVHPNGSVSVRMSSKGKPDDLADGYPIPLAAPWIADSEDTEAWIGGRVSSSDDLTLAVHADFRSVDELPQWIAPPSEPYRTAYLARSTDLRIDTKSGRRVYTFERVFHAREFERFDMWGAVEHRLPKALNEKLKQIGEDDSVQMTADERAELIDAATMTFIDKSIPHAENALLAVYTAGDASVDPRAVDRAIEDVRISLSGVVVRDRIAKLVDMFLAKRADDAKNDEIKQLESQLRESLRTSLDVTLAKNGVPLPTRNAVRGQLEWSFTAFDHTTDLGDESFKLIVHMPGIVVGGNFDERDGTSVSWKFDGEGLHDRDRVLRVVSVAD